MIEVPQAAIDLPKRFEGFCRVPKSDPDRAFPYVCPAGFWTIGYGHLCVAKHLPITMEQGEAYLAADMARFPQIPLSVISRDASARDAT